MDHPQYSTLLEALAAVPDPRHRRGKRHAWTLLLGVIASTLLSQQRSAAAMAQWAHEHAGGLVAAFHPQHQRVPSAATMRRALRHLDVRALETHRARLQKRLARAPVQVGTPRLPGSAVDGKYVRGAGTHGQRSLLVRLVRPHDGRGIRQQAVAPHHHAGKAIAQLLKNQDLRGMVLTLAAGVTDPKLARHIRKHGGHYLMVVKRNQAQVYQDRAWYVDTPPLPCDRPWRTYRPVTKGHGRLDDRVLSCRDDLDDELTWPGVQHGMQRTCERTVLKTQRLTRSTHSARTRVPAAAAAAAERAAWWRGHWTIETRVQYVRDVTMGEDGQQLYSGHAPQVLAAIRNALLNRLRVAGWTNIAAALRHYGAAVDKALRFLGVAPT